jgi:hypothetical protein
MESFQTTTPMLKNIKIKEDMINTLIIGIQQEIDPLRDLEGPLN